MKEVICTNDNYTEEKLEFFNKFGVTIPKKGKIYDISEVVKHSSGDVGVRLFQIDNPSVPIKHSVLGIIMYIPTFSIQRFTKLNGDVVTKKEIEEIIKQTQKV